MASNNLRIIYQNILDLTTTTITASSTATGGVTPVTNLALDSKSRVWRTDNIGTENTGVLAGTFQVKANLAISFPTNYQGVLGNTLIGGVIFPFCNLSSSATVRIRGFTGTIPTTGTGSNPAPGINGTLVFDTGTISASPYQNFGLWNWGALPLGVNSYSYGGGTYGRAWMSSLSACTSLLIEFIDNRCPSRYLEISRIVAGPYWSPKYNTSFGLATGSQDLSQHNRSESGDLITTRGIRYRSMKFDLNWLPPADRLEFTRILRGNGLPRPLFISLFPDNSEDWDKEQAHQIYGKLSTLNDITHPVFEMYSTSIEIEEI